MDLIVWLVIGGVIGWLASILMKTNAQMGIVANVIVGIIGAALGGWLAGVLGIAGGRVMSYVIAVAGAAILIAILRALGVFKYPSPLRNEGRHPAGPTAGSSRCPGRPRAPDPCRGT